MYPKRTLVDREELRATAEGICRNAASVDAPVDEDVAFATITNKNVNIRNQQNLWIYEELGKYIDHLSNAYIELYNLCNKKFREFFGLRYLQNFHLFLIQILILNP